MAGPKAFHRSQSAWWALVRRRGSAPSCPLVPLGAVAEVDVTGMLEREQPVSGEKPGYEVEPSGSERTASPAVMIAAPNGWPQRFFRYQRAALPAGQPSTMPTVS